MNSGALREELFRLIEEGPADDADVDTFRLGGMALLAAGAVQDVGGPLAYLMANLEFLDCQLERHDVDLPPGRARELRQCLREAIQGAVRIRDIVRDVANAGSKPPAPEHTDLHRVLYSCIKITRTEIEHRARVVTEFDAVPTVSGSESRLSRLFLNLMLNAAQAVAGDAGNEQFIRVSTRNEAGHSVVVDIADSGPGILPEDIERVFEPFFTTKPAGQGTGLGLAVCRQIASELGGSVVLLSTPGRGATFRVTLPVSREDARIAGGPASETRFVPSAPPVRRLPLRQIG